METIANEILELLTKHYGRSNFYNYIPTICFDDSDTFLSGEWRNDWGQIVLYTQHLDLIPKQYLKDEIATIINHEYIHYLQSPTWMTRYNKMYNYYEHPYEIEAYEKEEEWRLLEAS